MTLSGSHEGRRLRTGRGGEGSSPACGPDFMRYAFIFFQHVVKFITLGNDFLTVVGKEKERKKKGP